MPVELRDEWRKWTTVDPEWRVAPIDVVIFPHLYAGFRPCGLEPVGDSVVIPLGLVPFFRARNVSRNWDSYTSYCDPPPEWTLIDNVFPVAWLPMSEWVPIMIVPLQP